MCRRRGDLIWTDFDPSRGRKQAGRRPALVVSAAGFSANTGFAVVCPITSRARPFPTSVVLAIRPAGRRRDPDQSRPQRRHLGPADPLCGRRRAGAASAAREGQAVQRLHYLIPVERPRGPKGNFIELPLHSQTPN